MSSLRHRLAVQGEVLVPDGKGGSALSFIELFKVWARIEAAAGGEIVRAEQISPGASYRVTIRYRSDIPARGRLQTGAKVLRIESLVDPTGRREQLELVCREEAGAP